MTQTRNPENVQPLEDQQVLASFADAPKISMHGIFDKTWHTVGILTDDGTKDITRTVDTETVNGAGFGVVARQHKPGDLTGQFVTLEDNEVTRYIGEPHNVVVDGVRITGHSGKVAQAHICYVDVLQNGNIQLRATRKKADLKMEQLGRGMSAEGREVSVGFITGTDKMVFELREFHVEEDGTMTEVKPTIFVADEAVTGEGTFKVAEGTATEVDSKDKINFKDASAGK